jgi:hypothetical protein
MLSKLASPRCVTLACSLFALSTTGCDDVDEYSNEGGLCLTQSAETGDVRVRVYVGQYSSGCSRLASSSCAITRDGATLTVTNRTRVELGGDCFDGLRAYHSECTLVGAPAGEYSLRHGEVETTVSLPLPDGAWSNDDGLLATCL